MKNAVRLALLLLVALPAAAQQLPASPAPTLGDAGIAVMAAALVGSGAVLIRRRTKR